jgi:poly(3-hydroxybutyrate) depolymerase
MTVTQFKRSRRVVATLVQVGRLGHAWSGGAARQRFSDANGPDASRMVWRFAEKQFRPA